MNPEKTKDDWKNFGVHRNDEKKPRDLFRVKLLASDLLGNVMLSAIKALVSVLLVILGMALFFSIIFFPPFFVGTWINNSFMHGDPQYWVPDCFFVSLPWLGFVICFAFNISQAIDEWEKGVLRKNSRDPFFP